MKLLKEYISNILIKEDIHKKPGFSLDKAKKITDKDELWIYLNEYLQSLGRGSSREAFLYSSKKIIKIALNNAGLGQNEAEVDFYTNPKLKPLSTKIYDYDKNNLWIISELVRPISKEEFHQVFGIDFESFMDLAYLVLKGTNKKEDIEFSSQKTNQFFNMLIDNIVVGQLCFGDIQVIDHWGKSTTGDIVMLDYGFNREVQCKYYKRNVNMSKIKLIPTSTLILKSDEVTKVA